MKRIIFVLILFLVLRCYSEDLPEAVKSNTGIILDEVILPKGEDTYMEVRHIILQGTNVEIGSAIGKIAQSWLNIVPNKYIDGLYAKARNRYMLNNDSILYLRMQGVAQAYNIHFNNTVMDISSLPYSTDVYSCSAVNFTAGIMKNNCNVVARNNGCYVKLSDDARFKDDLKLFKHNFVMELYPNIGYSSIIFGSFDLLNGVFDGLNSAGLYVGCMAVDSAPVRYNIQASGGKMTGSSMLQAARQVLDTCSTVEEAKVLLLSLKVSNVLAGLHMMVVDKEGNSFIYELSNDDETATFTDNNGMPQIITHFDSYMYPDESHFPRTYEKSLSNPFYRYHLLNSEIINRKSKLTEDDVWNMMSKVYMNCMKTTEGSKYEIPFRTLWKVMINQNTLDCKIIFYLNDISDDDGSTKLNFSKPFNFKLGQLKKKVKKSSTAINL